LTYGHDKTLTSLEINDLGKSKIKCKIFVKNRDTAH